MPESLRGPYGAGKFAHFDPKNLGRALNLKFLYRSKQSTACWLRLVRHFVFTEQRAALAPFLPFHAQRLDPDALHRNGHR